VRDTPDVIELTADDCQRILTDGRIAHIACTSQGEPYVTPMSFVMIEGDFYFRTGPGRRVDGLRSAPRACIEVTILREGDAWESVVFWGTSRFIDDPTERSRVVEALLHKYHTDTVLGASTPSIVPTDLPIVAVTPESVTGRASGGGLTSKTRPGRL
jgi:nitroimidazol reductase NimA-like FMN-containing flavoprotein (pyridoxamine 5'-phosphate oxidase superfamily)